jgi:DNA-binding response OmpR family regulator
MMTVTATAARVKTLTSAMSDFDELCEFPISEPPRILIVEDDPHVAELIGTLLSRNWFNCVIRRSGAQGIQAFIHESVDLIITDLKMQAGDGVSLIESIRRMSSAPVIIITGFASEYADRIRFLDNVALIRKPFEPEALIALIDKALDTNNTGTSKGWNKSPEQP